MANVPVIVGLPQILRNLKRKNEELARGCERGVKRAGLFLQRQSQKLVPVDTGNLKASAFTRAEGRGFKINVFVGYTAFYALYVHENPEIWPPGMRLKGQPREAPKKGMKGFRGYYWDPQGRAQPKFLEAPARRHRQELRRMIMDSMKIR